VGFAARKQWELGNLPSRVRRWMQCHRTPGRYREAGCLALRLGYGEIRVGCWVPGRLLCLVAPPSLYEPGHAALCLSGCMGVSLAVGCCVHGSCDALGTNLAGRSSDISRSLRHERDGRRGGDDGDELSRLYRWSKLHKAGSWERS
jgi:hypothetical protein